MIKKNEIIIFQVLFTAFAHLFTPLVVQLFETWLFDKTLVLEYSLFLERFYELTSEEKYS